MKTNTSKQPEQTVESLQAENAKLKKKIEEMNEKLINKKLKKKEMKEKYKTLLKKFEALEKEKINLIKENIQEKADQETKNLINTLNDKITEQTQVIEDFKEELIFLKGENKKLKNATRKIIEQRNETEIFFLISLEDVKREQYKKMKEQSKRGNFFPTLKKKYETDRVKVDIKTLDPYMKEKVLRNLFTKINEGYDPEKYKELNDIMAMDLNEYE